MIAGRTLQVSSYYSAPFYTGAVQKNPRSGHCDLIVDFFITLGRVTEGTVTPEQKDSCLNCDL